MRLKGKKLSKKGVVLIHFSHFEKNNPEWKTFGKKGVVLIHFLHFDKLLAHPGFLLNKFNSIFIKDFHLKVNINLHFLAN